ncbi:patatin-like phospholipase family protein [Parasphingopyxis marina]|uniref:Patatin-like phospholipase family protein n=1 Tax=Parasphingopyxis marina TaxID=2761622 RepID=A0A842HZE9_9SPHN|nr:cyclic nucleotide-binding and patatin-like phospholipase domain-containing protein [Parasphingopyxis marina]MBC2778332.1 patatin-like phospholipase family protein [Parasphingopyxis marina]
MANDFSQVEAFAGLDEAALQALQNAAKAVPIKGGDYLVRYGEEADALFLVLTGRFYVQLPNGRVVAEIGAGEPVGELAFFSGGTRTADVRASRDSTVYELSRDAYDGVVAEHPKIADGILAAVSERLAIATRSAQAMEAKPGKVLALITSANTGLPEGFAERICVALQHHGEPRMVTIADKPAGIVPDSEGFGRWLGELERSAKRIILVAAGDPEWDRAIARNSDDLLLVAPLFEEECARSELEDYAIPLFLRANRTLILWREREAQEITGSGRWLDSRNVKTHHHVPLDCDASFARVGRFLSGKANGVVLAGGGALGCAHIGVMQALVENGIPIDFYGGTSAGAAMGGALAQGLTPEQTILQMEEMFIRKKAMRRMTIPVHSILDPRVFDEELKERYTEKDIADLPYNFFGVSTNLSTNSVYVHRRGPLWHAVRASGSLPTILPPFITEEGDILVDGGVLDNIPVTIMREAKAGPNVVVSLRSDAGEDWRLETKYHHLRTRGQLLRDVLFRRKAKQEFPSIVEIMSRSMVVSSASAVRESLSQADVLLVPPVPETMKILDWHLGKDLSEAARVFTTQRIIENLKLADMKAV